jgi:M6 family metalloprotease-like protein
LAACGGRSAEQTQDNELGPQSSIGKGEQRLLVAVVRFPDVQPGFTLEQIYTRAVERLNRYVQEQSYGLGTVKADFRGWIALPDSISRYSVSPYNYQVDRNRVRKLIEDTMTALEPGADFARYDHMLIIPAAHTLPGKGYGMICYCANPGMLTGVRGKLGYATLTSKGGKEFRGGVFVGAENAHLGMFAHDFFHALGGIRNGRRLVPCLYDFDRQSDASHAPSPEHHAIYMGPWDIMSEHFVRQGEPPAGISSFTKIRLGWISSRQAVFAAPGKDTMAFLSPLAKGGGQLVVKIPLPDGRYYLVENRQPTGFDRSLPDSGIVILMVDPQAPEGSGTVRLMNAKPSSAHFSQAAFVLSDPNRNIFSDPKHHLSIVPLWVEGDRTGVLVTTPDRSAEALQAAAAIATQMHRTTSGHDSRQITEAVKAFRHFDFKAALAAAENIRPD